MLVLDASIALAWYLDNPVPPLAIRVRRALESGERAVVPALWHLEIANTFVFAERRGAATKAVIDSCVNELYQFLIHAIETQTEAISMRAAMATARAFQLTAYDAVYLELARELDLPLASLDQPLRAAAKRASVRLFS